MRWRRHVDIRRLSRRRWREEAADKEIDYDGVTRTRTDVRNVAVHSTAIYEAAPDPGRR